MIDFRANYADVYTWNETYINSHIVPAAHIDAAIKRPADHESVRDHTYSTQAFRRGIGGQTGLHFHILGI